MNRISWSVIVEHPLVEVLGWTLLHSIWQIALLGLIAALVLACISRRSSSVRFWVANASMVLMALCVGLTGVNQFSKTNFDFAKGNVVAKVDNQWSGAALSKWNRIDQNGRTGDDLKPSTDISIPQVLMSEGQLDAQSAATNIVSSTSQLQLDSMVKWLLPWLVAVWLAGVTGLGLRLLMGVWRVRRWQKRGVEMTSPELRQVFERLISKLSLKTPVRLLESLETSVPAVIGVWRPVILIPTSMLTGLTAFELEAVLAHELAHIRRHDYFLNLIQSMVEVVLFYHPVIWWVSAQIRIERENSCDDAAVEICGDRVALARALSKVEAQRHGDSGLAIAASDGSLVRRIRRIVGVESRQGAWMPVGGMTLVTIGLLICCTLIASAYAIPSPTTSDETESERWFEDQEINDRKSEVKRTDSKTGIEQLVLPDIHLRCGPAGNRRVANVEMKYSNLFRYTLIPARLAEELNATELGEIDFGEAAPQRGVLDLQIHQVHDESAPPQQIDNEQQSDGQFLLLHELAGPLDDGQRIIPYGDDPVWLPDHLGFYGMNQSKQRKFRVVRIEKVALGVGPAIGPVNALVLDDANSDFGLLGMDWIQQVTGEQGEQLFFASNGTFHFMAPPKQKSEAVPSPRPPIQDPGSMTVTSTGPESTIKRTEQPGVHTIATHTYSMGRRESKSWLELNGVNVPIDDGVTHNKVFVAVTMMFDVVAVDAETRKPLWVLDWHKTAPIWETVSIVELDRARNAVEVAVELFAVDHKNNEPIYQYHNLQTGERIEAPKMSAAKALVFPLYVEAEGDVVKRVELKAIAEGRTPADLVKMWRAIPGFNLETSDSITEQETLVSAENARWIGNGVDAQEIIFNLPEGSNTRAEFFGEKVEITQFEDHATVTITNGKLRLLDAGGVERAWASPDGGAEQLVVECRFENNEYVMRLRSQRIKEDADYPNPPVQCVVNPDTGAPKNEEQPPHGSVRYEVQEKVDEQRYRLKMKWRYDVKRVLDQANPNPLPKATNQIGQASGEGWGPIAQESKLRSRLTLQTERPEIGKPLLLQLEVKNFGNEAWELDLQRYAPFRVLQVQNEDFTNAAPFIGMTTQTSDERVKLKPGESRVIWKGVPVNELFLLSQARDFFVVAKGGEWATQTLWRDSNRLKIRMKPGELTEREQLISGIVDVLPEAWSLANDLEAMYLNYKPSNLKHDALAIQIWFTEEPLSDDFRLGEGATEQRIARLGRCDLGYMNIAAPVDASAIWPEYASELKVAASRVLQFESSGQSEADKLLMWQATGTVRDIDGKPIAGAVVCAHCGFGTLFETGSATTNEDGVYVLNFGPGIFTEEKTALQAATISVRKDGFFEQNLGRQGDKLAAYQMPEGEIGWGGKKPDDIFLPGQPKQIDFVLDHATTFRGQVRSDNGQPAVGYRVSLTGDELPPSSSVLAQVRTGESGEFEIANIPTGFAFQVLIERPKAESPWLAWASPGIKFLSGKSESTTIEYTNGNNQVGLEFTRVVVKLDGAGTNWKDALANSATQKFNLTWGRPEISDTIHVGDVFLELSDKAQ
ncbi:MAG: M56 family metallopeptidase [Pirellulaceae bacterium]